MRGVETSWKASKTSKDGSRWCTRRRCASACVRKREEREVVRPWVGVDLFLFPNSDKHLLIL
ncbi:unnamed protein product [Phytomonas sp. EM1]|nr:unnamed protein product [Phytomonas sp. EM1]|eukprot:CCW65898.1 unnamed protein product [Phytomonas sp. isolate EM1]